MPASARIGTSINYATGLDNDFSFLEDICGAVDHCSDTSADLADEGWDRPSAGTDIFGSKTVATNTKELEKLIDRTEPAELIEILQEISVKNPELLVSKELFKREGKGDVFFTMSSRDSSGLEHTVCYSAEGISRVLQHSGAKIVSSDGQAMGCLSSHSVVSGPAAETLKQLAAQYQTTTSRPDVMMRAETVGPLLTPPTSTLLSPMFPCLHSPSPIPDRLASPVNGNVYCDEHTSAVNGTTSYSCSLSSSDPFSYSFNNDHIVSVACDEHTIILQGANYGHTSSARCSENPNVHKVWPQAITPDHVRENHYGHGLDQRQAVRPAVNPMNGMGQATIMFHQYSSRRSGPSDNMMAIEGLGLVPGNSPGHFMKAEGLKVYEEPPALDRKNHEYHSSDLYLSHWGHNGP